VLETNVAYLLIRTDDLVHRHADAGKGQGRDATRAECAPISCLSIADDMHDIVPVRGGLSPRLTPYAMDADPRHSIPIQ
jgi:hypothetical protein